MGKNFANWHMLVSVEEMLVPRLPWSFVWTQKCLQSSRAHFRVMKELMALSRELGSQVNTVLHPAFPVLAVLQRCECLEPASPHPHPRPYGILTWPCSRLGWSRAGFPQVNMGRGYKTKARQAIPPSLSAEGPQTIRKEKPWKAHSRSRKEMRDFL